MNSKRNRTRLDKMDTVQPGPRPGGAWANAWAPVWDETPPTVPAATTKNVQPDPAADRRNAK